ncbi:MAG TPA: helical backbone metal receptor, partial [Candidatus Sulfomarinibacteraceae bacterium]|nr:helical backbone metal receptor [Candidatus Sulfomarinibacteraceae bacterium]
TMLRGRLTVLLALAVVAGWGCAPRSPDGPEPAPAPPQRIVSLAPSLTETLFALGVGGRVVGVTRYCAHPPEVRTLPRIGGHLDPSYEAIVALEPDLVVAIPSSEASEARLRSLGVPVLRVDQHDVDSVLQSISVLAEACGVEGRGVELRREMERRLEAVARAAAGRERRRAGVVVGHEIGAGAVRSVWAAGPETFYDGVLELAGGINAVQGGIVRYPELSREGLAALDPDVVIDVVAGVEERGTDIDRIRSGWQALTELRAVREGRVRVLEGDVMVVPGPRLPEMVAAVAAALAAEPDGGGR